MLNSGHCFFICLRQFDDEVVVEMAKPYGGMESMYCRLVVHQFHMADDLVITLMWKMTKWLPSLLFDRAQVREVPLFVLASIKSLNELISQLDEVGDVLRLKFLEPLGFSTG